MLAGRLEIELAAEVARLRRDLQGGTDLLRNFVRDTDRMIRGLATTIGSVLGAAIGAISFDAIIKSAHEGEKSMLRLDAVIKATGASAGMSRAQIDALADSLAEVTQFTDEGFKDAAANIIRFGNISGQQFERTLKAAADLAAFTGTDVPAAAETLAKALASPAQGIERLQRTIGYLDESQIKAIKTMVEMGDTVGAQNEILEIMEKRLGGVAETMNTGYTKALGDAKKATDELFESIGRSGPVQATTTSFLTFVSDTFKDLKKIIEEGDWVEKALRLMAFAGGWRGVGNPTSGGAPGDGGAAARESALQAEAERLRKHRADMLAQDERAEKIALERQKKSAEEAFRARVAFAEAELKADEMFARDYAEAWKYADEYRNKEAEAAAKERDFIAKQEAEGNEDFAKIYAEAWRYANQQILAESRAREREERALWEGISDVVGTFFSDLVMNGKSAFDNLRRFVKQLLADMVALFAKRWVLQVAGVSGGASGGGDSIAGSLVNAGVSAVGNWAAGAAGFTGMGTMAGFTGAMTGAIPAAAIGAEAVAAGVGVNTVGTALGSSLSGVYSALAAIPVWGWIAMAVIAIGAWIAGKHKGGDKVGGSFFQGGAVPGTDNGRFFTPNQGDSYVRQMVEVTSLGYRDAVARLGGTAGGFNFGLGFDHDPAGTQQSRVSSMLTDAQGNIVYRRDNAGMDDKEVEGALALETQRMLVRALQETDLHDAIDALLDPFNATIATSEQLQAVLAQALEMKSIIDVLAIWNVEGMDIEAIQALQQGGETLTQTLERVGSALQTFEQLFYTESERHALGLERMNRQFEALGIVAPTSRDAFRALVESLDKDSPLWFAVISMAGAFDTLYPAIENVGDAVDDLADTTVAATQLFTAAVGQVVNGINDPLTLFAQGKPARDGLGSYLDNLSTGRSAPVGSDQRLREAVRQYEDALKLAQGGDVGAIGRLSGLHSTALGLYQQIYGSGSQTVDFYNRTFDQMAAISGVPNLQERTAKATEALLAKVSRTADSLEAIQQDQRTATDMIVKAVNANADRIARAVEAAPLGQR